ncbi:GINS complex subunit 2 [Nematocida displodere]|uniref:GINS complex subunit 2 n=1 Tax=Nematocida displodere TaxID=1805483 RepID=A0A177EBU3_9MICR|nr:GINS complex subunit 2 [Nematocida displodere]
MSNLSRAAESFAQNITGRVRREREGEMLLAQRQRVLITPLVSIGRLEMIEGSFGPFSPMVPATVPLYIALLLKHSSLCTVHLPDYLSTACLKRAVEKEEETEDEFGSIDMYTFENANVCLESCDSVESVSEIRVLLERLKEVRMNKLLKGFKDIDTSIIGVNRLTFYEFRRIKEYLIPHLQISRRLDG